MHFLEVFIIDITITFINNMHDCYCLPQVCVGVCVVDCVEDVFTMVMINFINPNGKL